jgi:hypothetical protein
MKRVQVFALVTISLVSASFALGTAAHAAPKKKAAPKAAQEPPQSAEINKAMGDLKWGTTRDDVLARFTNEIKERYRPQIAKATGAIEEDKLRARMRDELSRLKASVVDFNGKKTGWDVSFLKGEFTHHNDESLFAVNDDTSQNYYFFIDGKLWKWFKAFNASTFRGKTFDQFAEAIQGRYGKAQVREGEVVPGEGKQRWLEWQDANTRLRAVDNTQFYGFYCLVFEHKDTMRRLPELRTAAPREERNKNALVDSVTSGPDEEDSADNNQDVIDRITGKIRRRQDAPEAAKGGAPAANKPSPAPSADEGRNSNDPLRGL